MKRYNLWSIIITRKLLKFNKAFIIHEKVIGISLPKFIERSTRLIVKNWCNGFRLLSDCFLLLISVCLSQSIIRTRREMSLRVCGTYSRLFSDQCHQTKNCLSVFHASGNPFGLDLWALTCVESLPRCSNFSLPSPKQHQLSYKVGTGGGLDFFFLCHRRCHICRHALWAFPWRAQPLHMAKF